MKLKLTLKRAGAPGDDVVVDTDPGATVGSIAATLAARDPRRSSGAAAGDEPTLRIDGPDAPRVLAPDRSLAEVGLRSGDSVSLIPGDGRYVDASDARASVASLIVADGPDAGQRFALGAGANQVGRDHGSEVRLTDPMVSKRHARLNVSDVVEVLDLGSANGTFVGGELVQRAVVRPGDRILLGDTALVVEQVRTGSVQASGNDLEFNRSPYLDPRYEGEKAVAPDLPDRPRINKLPWVPMLVPLAFGAVMYAVTRQVYTLMFMFMSPVMGIGMFWQQKITTRREFEEGSRQFRAALDHMTALVDIQRQTEAASRRREHLPSTQVISAVHARGPLLWVRRPDRHGFLELRAGLATLPTRSEVETPDRNNSTPELWDELHAAVGARATVADVPVVAALPECGTVGVAGPRQLALGAARNLLVQLAGLHSPVEVVLAAVCPAESEDDWNWLKWLPHVTSDQSPLEGEHLGSGAGAQQVVAGLEQLIDDRVAGDAAGDEAGDGADAVVSSPAVVVVIDDGVPVERNRLIRLVERGPSVGVFAVWVAPAPTALPAAAEVFFTFDEANGTAGVGFIDGGSFVVPMQAEPVAAELVEPFARALAPLRDASSLRDEASNLPGSVSFLATVGTELGESASAVVERWQQSGSLPTPGVVVRSRRAAPLHATVGVTSTEPLLLDLRSHGPHALVGGTTGAGKSEFLQSWVIGLATTHSPKRATFLFVDYKGGAAFGECVKLPHCVGLVTDLTPHLVKRALRSLNAELRYREHVLNRHKAKDVLEMEKRGEPDTPPSLVIVVDEFAALVSEVPEFVDGVVNVAQRGRSLGLHLVLATQRPAGVIKDNLRANTNLRIALRMADESDSDDVVGSKQAAMFDPGTPGRAIAKTGPGRLLPFQAAYVGGWTSDTPPPPHLEVRELRLGAGRVWEVPEGDEIDDLDDDADTGPNDLSRLVSRVEEAADAAGLDAPRKPWLPELAPVYDLARTPQTRTDVELVFGIADDPDEQRQVPISFRPDTDGNMCVIGTGGSGKSAFLRTLAVSAGLSIKGGPCHVYGLDFAGRGLDMLEPLPHVGAVISGDDDERVTRLLRTLRQTIDERALRYTAVRAGTIEEYRRQANQPEEPRVLVLLDGIGAFRQTYELGQQGRYYDLLQTIATDGRAVGVHLVVSADRPAAIPSSLGSMIQRRLTLRLASENDYFMSNTPVDLFTESSPPGRGWIEGSEVQIAVLGGTASTAQQAQAIAGLADEIGRTVDRAPAPRVGSLPEAVELADLPVGSPGRPVVGLEDESLAPFAVHLDTAFLVVGPPRSGKTTTLTAIAAALRRSNPQVELLYVGDGRSPLATMVDWSRRVESDPEIEELAAELVPGFDEGSVPSGSMAFFLDNAPKLAARPSDQKLVTLVEAALGAGQFVISDGETSAMGGSWPLFKVLKVTRAGLALVPDQYDGDSVFKTPFPRTTRAQFPPGRGLLVRDGNVAKVQIALPEVD